MYHILLPVGLQKVCDNLNVWTLYVSFPGITPWHLHSQWNRMASLVNTDVCSKALTVSSKKSGIRERFKSDDSIVFDTVSHCSISIYRRSCQWRRYVQRLFELIRQACHVDLIMWYLILYHKTDCCCRLYTILYISVWY